MADIRVKFNPDTDDVEIIVGDTLVGTVGPDLVQSWIMAYNDKHGFVKPELVVEETSTEEVVTESESSDDDESEADAEGEISA